MKRRALTIMLALSLSTVSLAQTLGEATQQVRDRSEALIAQRLPQADTWGEQTAVEDLRMVHQSASALYEALSGNDAVDIKTFQQNLTTAARRMKTSHSLLPDAEADNAAVAEMEGQVAAIDSRLTELRLRFDEKATLTPGPLANEPLSPDDPAYDIYINPQALLIDVRDARRLVSQLRVGQYAGYGVGFFTGMPNNLDSLQLRRLVLASWNLERALEGQYNDISDVQDEWHTFRREYDRMGYPGSNNVTRQLERVVDRLTLFFGDVAQQ